jgi:hypothetical protein
MVLVVAVGVILGAVLAVTPITGIVTSLAAAFMLAIVDRRLVAQRLERWNRRENIRLLKDELSACAITLARIRLIQIEIDAMASYIASRVDEERITRTFRNKSQPGNHAAYLPVDGDINGVVIRQGHLETA